MNCNCGIYWIKNRYNNFVYVGQSAFLGQRKSQHFSKLRNNSHTNPHLQNAYNLYGENNFIFEILEYSDADSLTICEQKWVEYCTNNNITTYNIRETVNSNLGIKRSAEANQKTRLALQGRKYTEQHKQNISKSLMGKTNNKGYKQTESHIRKCLIARQKPVAQIDIVTHQVISVWESAKIAESALGISRYNISSVCNNKRKQAGGYSWQFIKE